MAGLKLREKLKEGKRDSEAKIIKTKSSATISAFPRGVIEATARTIGELMSKTKIPTETKLPFINVPERKAIDWKDIKRSKSVYIFSDSYGSYEGFYQTYRELGIIESKDNSFEFVGDDAHYVMLGDIFADRVPTSFYVSAALDYLEPQIAEKGGSLTVIAGNHDDAFIDFFMYGCIANCQIASGKYGPQGLGILELKEFGSPELQAMAYDDPLIWVTLSDERLDILANMRKDPKGIAILKRICSLKLAHLIDDTVFIHTPPSQEIVDAILQGTAQESLSDYLQKINFIYQETLRNFFFEGKEASFHLEGFPELKKIFLNTDTRKNFLQTVPNPDEYVEKLRKLGINAFVHGHECVDRCPSKSHNGLTIVSTDAAAFHLSPWPYSNRSIAIIAEDGTILVRENHYKLRKR